MRRRSFLKWICGAGAALLAPAVASRQTGPAAPPYLTDPDEWFLSEAALEEVIIEIDEFPPASRPKLIAIKPTYVVCYPEDRKAAFKLMGI